MKSKLFEELTIGSMKLRNATFMAPMSLGYESQEGTVNDIMQEYWLARARGGVGCIILDALSVDPNFPYLGNTLCFRSEASIEHYKAFTDKIHEAGAKIIPQITHPGPESISAFMGIPPLASSVYLNSMAQKTRAVTLEEIPHIIELYAQASYNAKLAGFDGIELHCAHAYMLLGSFLSPLRNKRCDQYGGSLENRARLLLEVMDAIKERCGKDFPIILRISGDEKLDGGNHVSDICQLVPLLEAHGVDALEISGGTQYESPNKIIPSHGEIEGVNVAQAKAIKQVASIPVIVVGKITDPMMAMKIVDQDHLDGVVLGRSLLADENFVNKAKEGKYEEIAPCTGCVLGCVGEQTKRRHATCVINPSVGREKEMQIIPCTTKKHVAIAGGGIGGLAAARWAALRGHDVTLYESSDHLGGQLCLACIPPHKQSISKWVIYLKNECQRLGVNIHLQTPFTKAMADEYDAIICATGAKESIPPIPGVDKETAITAWNIIENNVVIPGGNALVVGGGMVGCEVSEHLCHQARGPLAITMIEMEDEIAKGMVINDRIGMMKRLYASGINMMTNTRLCKVEGNTVTLEQNNELIKKTFTHIVYATGSKSDSTLYEELKDHKEVYNIGDSKEVAQALEAVRDGALAAMKL